MFDRKLSRFFFVLMSSKWRRIPFALCVLALAYGVFRAQPPPDLFLQSDKVLHVVAFFGLALCTRLAFCNARWLGVLAGLLLAAAGTEYLQQWVQPLRMFSVYDAAANGVGVMLGVVAWVALLRVCRARA
ncbi:VanZ family protein [Pusillimonas minor]|uniref:VanZ family protein n=1 Tax=Pusillimonas minor TaxID=2697024 RepID=A0A842HPS1_9BURK|nr:VanZ family protein [Pusillimonas minor]MBC2769854.1 VanZ family protein [Pusillimonas minor]